MTESQKIPWKRIGIEASAIVVSILLAFAIDAWWDDKQEERRLHNSLENLRAGFSSSIERIDVNLKDVRSSQQLVIRFLNMTPDDTASLSDESRYETLSAIRRPRTLPLNNNLLDVMLDAEGLNSLGDPALQERITEWRDTVAELNELKTALADNQRAMLLALGHYSNFWPYMMTGAQDAPPFSSEMMQQIRSDKYFMAIVASKASSIQRHVRTLQFLREDADSVLATIDSELAKRP